MSQAIQSAYSRLDASFMARALELAAKGLYTTQPNPRVGCVIVTPEHNIIGEGWHQRAGAAHAEIIALEQAGEKAQGATVYVTLEPCAHYGRTPPCVQALIQARVGRVVIATQDPNPQVNGQGIQALRAAGIIVDSGLQQAEAIALNPGFFKRFQQQRPYVRLKLAMSLDGRTALANGQSRWITNTACRADVQHWRARSSAILTGIGTVLADDPALTVRLPDFAGQPPLRVVLDSQLRLPAAAQLLHLPGMTCVFTTVNTLPTWVKQTQHKVIQVATDRNNQVDLNAVMQHLAQLEINEVWTECGSRLAGALLQQRLVDEVILYIAPCFLGQQARELLQLPELTDLQQQLKLTPIATDIFDNNWRLILKPNL